MAARTGTSACATEEEEMAQAVVPFAGCSAISVESPDSSWQMR